jgi:hypothetical protein
MKARGLLVCFVLCLLMALVYTISVVHAAANLMVTSVSGPAKAYTSKTVSVTCEIQNQGEEGSGPYELSLYLSKDETIDPATDRLLKKRSFNTGLAAGETKKIVTKVTIPNPYLDGLTGSYYYGAAVNASSMASTTQVTILRYKKNGNGTVTDFKTGLMWQKATQLMPRTWTEAEAYCNGLVLGGHEDWRVPSIDELVTLIDYSRSIPATDLVFHCVYSFYASSTTCATSEDYAWYVYFYNGSVEERHKDNAEYVRCVRNGP